MVEMAEEGCFQPHHIKIMKVALALAIIRSKPDGVSAEEYTRRLALKLNQLQTDWREKALHLERELLRTRQELISHQVNSELVRQKEEGGALSQTQPTLTDSEWVSSGYASSTQDEPMEALEPSTLLHGMGNHSKDELQQGLGNHDNHQSDCSDLSVKMHLQERIRCHVKFCSSVSTLGSLHGRLSDLVTFDLRANLHDTLIDAIKGLTESLNCDGSWTPLGSSVTQELFISAASSVVDCLQLPLLAPMLQDLTEACCTLTSALIEHLVHKCSSPVLRSGLVVLCAVPPVYCHTLRAAVTEIVNCAENLKLAMEDVKKLNVSLVENIGVLIRSAEELLGKYGSALSDEECAGFIEELDSCLVGLIDSFPLYCYSVWRLITYLDRSTANTV